MKVFNEENTRWSTKTNFVDDKNVFLGYDMSSNCYEEFGWFISDKVHVVFDTHETPEQNKEIDNLNKELENYLFDTGFIVYVQNKDKLEDGGCAIFRITDGTNEKFIHLFNNHNGYYHHGFEFKTEHYQIKKDSL